MLRPSKFILGAALALPFNPAYATDLSLEEFLEVRDLSSMALSPDGKSVAVRVSHDTVRSNRHLEEWYVITLGATPSAKWIADAGEPDRYVNGPASGPVSVEAPVWSQDSKWIYYRAIRDAQLQVWRTEVSSGRTQQLTHDDGDVIQFVLDPGTSTVMYAVAATRAEIEAVEQDLYRDGVLLDRSFLPNQPVVRNHPVNGRLLTFRRSRSPRAFLGFAPLLSERPETIKVLDPSSGRGAEVSADQLALYRSLVEQVRSPIELRSPRGTVTIAADQVKGAPKRLRFRPVGPGAREVVCNDMACSATDSRLGFNADDRALTLVGWAGDSAVVFHKSEFHGEGLYWWEIGAPKVRRIAFTEGLLRGTSRGYGSCLLSGMEALCAVADADRAPRLQAISLRSGQSRLLFDPNPRLTSDRLGRTERITIRTPDDDLTYGFLVLPRERASNPLPLVITDYNCEGFIRPEDDVSEHIMAAAGIASFCLNDNGFARRPKSDAIASVVEGVRTPDRMQVSIAFRTAVVEQLAQRGLVDPKRVALAGMSGGATQVTYVLSRSDAFVAGMITTATYDDPMSAYLNAAFLQRDNRAAPEQYLAAVSAALSPQGMEPLLMQVPDREYAYNLQLFSAMTISGRPVEMIIYPDEFHIKVQPQHRFSAYTRGHDWFRFWLQGYEDPAAEKRPQYERWRHLRERNGR